MNFALFVNSGILKPLQVLLRWWRADGPRAALAAAANHEIRRKTPDSIATNPLVTGASSDITAFKKPLRVVRVVEAGQARTSVGRMVISGRMADVCAELDRLAAREAALS
jgi:hypothetical protein